MRDAKGDLWFVSFDAQGYPEAATGAILVANKIFWTLGYWQVENHLVAIRPDQLDIADTATVRPAVRQGAADASQRPRRRAARARIAAPTAPIARSPRAPCPGKPLGGFRYHGTRPDDPNDVVPHEHRRELRALKVFGAWTNLVDMKAGNTLDTLITENGRSVVRHYLQDVGSTFGTGANGAARVRRGLGVPVRRRPRDGSVSRPWASICSRGRRCRTTSTARSAASKATAFDPPGWKPRVPTAAFLRARSTTTRSGRRVA